MDNMSKMVEARIPIEAQQTTLAKLGWVSLREHISDGVEPMVFKPGNPRRVIESNLLFYVYAKETRLSGRSLMCLSLAELVAVVFGELEDFRGSVLTGVTPKHLYSLDAIAVSSFCDTGDTFLTNVQRYTVASFLLTLMRSGKRVILGLDAFRHLDAWWPTQLTAYVAKNGTVILSGGATEDE
jgi:hypothetical protein